MQELLNLARETSSEKRRELMGRVADHFVDGSDKYSDRELNLFSDVMTQLLTEVDEDGRRNLSDKIADVADTPRDLTMALAQDKIHIAQPVLEKSPVLDSNDLRMIAQKQGKEHRLSISRRDHLDENVTDVLIEHGEMEVLQNVSGNNTARISNWGFDKLSKEASSDGKILQNLSVRHDMTLDAARNVMPLLDPSAQQKLLSMMQEGGAVLDELVGKAARKTSEKKIVKARKRLETKTLISSIRAGTNTRDNAVILLSHEDRPMDCAAVLSTISGMPEPQVANALLKFNGETISLLCKALSVSDDAFTKLSEMRCGGGYSERKSGVCFANHASGRACSCHASRCCGGATRDAFVSGKRNSIAALPPDAL